MRRLIVSAWVIARRDYTATVFSRIFLLFLLGPLFPILFGIVFGAIGSHSEGPPPRPVVSTPVTSSIFLCSLISHPIRRGRIVAKRDLRSGRELGFVASAKGVDVRHDHDAHENCERRDLGDHLNVFVGQGRILPIAGLDRWRRTS